MYFVYNVIINSCNNVVICDFVTSYNYIYGLQKGITETQSNNTPGTRIIEHVQKHNPT